MLKNISDLDLSTEVDILFAFKNLKKYPELLQKIKYFDIPDFGFGIFCYGIIESICLDELGGNYVDPELNELITDSLKCKDDSNKLIGGTDIIHEEQKSDTINISNLNTQSLNRNVLEDDKSPENIDEDDEELFYVRNLSTILYPLLGTCNKQIVDLIYYVYKKTGLDHFSILFESFKAISQQIELHLLVAKGLKSKSFDLRDLKEYLDHHVNTSDKDGGIKEFSLGSGTESIIPLPFTINKEDSGVDFKGNSHSNDDESINSSDYDVSSDSVNNLELKPFKSTSIKSFGYHISKAKKLLLSYTDSSSSFWIDNLASYLCLKFDDEIFEKFLQFKAEPGFCLNLNKMSSVPFFFYEYCDIKRLLALSTKVFHDPYKTNTQNLPYQKLKLNSYILKAYLQFADKVFNNIDSALSDYLLLARSLKTFVEHYRSKSFYKIFYELLNCKISKVEDEIIRTIIADLPLYLDVFLSEDVIFTPPSDIPGDILMAEKEKQEDTIDNNSEDKNLQVQNTIGSSNIINLSVDMYKNTEKQNNHIPGFNDSFEALKTAFLNSAFYENLDNNLSDFFLDLYTKKYHFSKNEIFEFLEKIIFELSIDCDYKIYILNSFETVTKFFSNTKNFKNLIENIKSFPKINWRYKKVFISMLDTLQTFGIEKSWVVDELKNDKVFYIRKMIEKL